MLTNAEAYCMMSTSVFLHILLKPSIPKMKQSYTTNIVGVQKIMSFWNTHNRNNNLNFIYLPALLRI